jgi:Sigma-70, region 4
MSLVYSVSVIHGIIGACEPVVRGLLDDLDSRERAILENRVLATGGKQTLQELANKHSITRERARQIEEVVMERVRKRALNPLNNSLTRAAGHLRESVGAACPREYVFSDRIMRGDKIDQGISAQVVLKVLLWLAGPYEDYRGWLVRAPAAKVVGMTKKLVRKMIRKEPAALDAILTSVEGIGIHSEWCLKWVSVTVKARTFGDKIVRWDGSLSDKAFAVLQSSGKPMSIDDIFHEIGGAFSKRTLSNYLHAHHSRFRKSGPDVFSLTKWGGQEYTSVKDCILEQIAAHRGTMKKDQLIEKTCAARGLSKSTVIAVLNSPIFVHSSTGHVRLRIDDDPAPKAQDIEATKHCYRLFSGTGTTRDHGFWSYRLRVTRDTLRGSGTPISAPFGLLLGLRPGKRLSMSSPSRDISFSWTMPQPTIGSLQRTVHLLNASVGDHLFVIAAGRDKLDFRLAKRVDFEGKQGWERLCLEVTGTSVSSKQERIRSIAFALGLRGDVDTSPRTIRRRLEMRREQELIEYIPKDDLAADTEELGTLLDYVSRP